jgi:hypothetical protein
MGEEMPETNEIRGWKIDGWGLVRGLAMLFSAFLTITALHYLVVAFFRG